MDKQIRDMLLDSVEEALKDKEYCCKDPFGTGRFNVKRQDSARIKKVGSNAVVVLIRVVVDKSYCSQVCRELILRDVLPCIQHVASQFGTRSVVLPRDTVRVTERQLPKRVDLLARRWGWQMSSSVGFTAHPTTMTKVFPPRNSNGMPSVLASLTYSRMFQLSAS